VTSSHAASSRQDRTSDGGSRSDDPFLGYVRIASVAWRTLARVARCDHRLEARMGARAGRCGFTALGCARSWCCWPAL